MAWEEEQWIGDPPDEGEIQEEREQQWREGYHVTREHKKIRFKRMSLRHLRNTINYFKGYDVRPLVHEFKRRGYTCQCKKLYKKCVVHGKYMKR